MQFKDLANISDLDGPYQTAGLSYSQPSARSTANRLRRSRQNLGSYRHDLLVAMRLVNNIDKEIIQAEWENWLFDENVKCRHIETLLEKNMSDQDSSTDNKKNQESQGGNSKKSPEAVEKEHNQRMENLRKWQQDYCGSCKIEQELLEQRKLITL